jgi:hypothetical protein
LLWKIVVKKNEFGFHVWNHLSLEENNCEDAAFLREGGVWALWFRTRKLLNPGGDHEQKVIESCQQECGNVAIQGHKRTSFPERSPISNRRECSRIPPSCANIKTLACQPSWVNPELRLGPEHTIHSLSPQHPRLLINELSWNIVVTSLHFISSCSSHHHPPGCTEETPPGTSRHRTNITKSASVSLLVRPFEWH